MKYFLEQLRRGKTPDVETQNFASPQMTPHNVSAAVYDLMCRVLTVMAICVCVCMSQAQNVFVDAAAADDSGAGTSWATAKQTLAAGLAQAGANGTVFVKAGSYSTDAELVIPAGVTVMGGFAPSSTGTDTSLRNLPGANLHWNDNTWCTIVTGAGDHRIATVHGMLDGCVIRHGFTDTYGGGVLIDGANATVRYCVIKECDAINDGETPAEGGGAYLQNSGTLLNCVVTECRGDKGAGVAGGNGSLVSNTITRNRPTDCGVVADYDGNLYKTVVIGDQCWMRENLRTTHYADGTAISEGTTTSTTEPYRYKGYVSETQHVQAPNIFVRCGYFYNWTAVMHGAPSSNANPSGVQGICPDGWHVPSTTEWQQMIAFVKTQSRYYCNNNSSNVVKALSSKIGWNNNGNTCYPGNNPSANNRSLFTAQPAGYYDGSFYEYGNMSEYWTSTQSDGNYAYRQTIRYESDLGRSGYGKYYAYPVRCVKDS